MSASTWIEKRGNGRHRVSWRKDKSSKCHINLGKCSKKIAQHFQVRINELIEIRLVGAPLTSSLASWIQDIDGRLRSRMIELGLVDGCVNYTLGEWIEYYNLTRTLPKASTRVKWNNTCERLIKMFGSSTTMHAITKFHAQQFREHLQADGKSRGVGLAPATVNKHCSIANQYFRAACKMRVIGENPFEDIECCNIVNRQRMAFVEAHQIELLLMHLPRWQNRVILGLARYGGLRCPSEVVALKWDHVHLGDNSKSDPSYLLVPNLKTMHHTSVPEYRKVPVFPELAPFLDEAWEMRDSDATYVVSGDETIDLRRHEPNKLNLRTRFAKAIKRAGLSQWPKLFQTLRSSRQTELYAFHQPHLVCRWMGNTEAIAVDHYLQETGQHLADACNITTVNLGAHTGAEPSLMAHHAPSGKSPTLKNKAFPVIDHHDPSQEMPKWAMRDSN